MWPSAEDQHVHRCGGCCCCCCVSCGPVGLVQKETVAPTSQFKTVLASVGGEVKLQLLTSGRKKRTPAAATGLVDWGGGLGLGNAPPSQNV